MVDRKDVGDLMLKGNGGLYFRSFPNGWTTIASRAMVFDTEAKRQHFAVKLRGIGVSTERCEVK